MALIPIPNAPITFGSNFNELDPDCNCVTKEFLTPQYDDDQIEFMHKFDFCGDGDAITNGDFSDGDTGWTILGGGWSVINGLMCSDGTNGRFDQTTALVDGKKYIVVYEVKGSTKGNVQVSVSGYSGTLRNANGTFIEYLDNTGSTFISFQALSGFDGCIDNIRAFEMDLSVFVGDNLVTNGTFDTDLDDWSVGTDWAFSTSKACHSVAVNSATMQQDIIGSQVFLMYLVSMEVTDMTQGFVNINFVDPDYTTQNIVVDGVYEFILIKTGSQTIAEHGDLRLIILGSFDFDGCVDNIVIKSYNPDLVQVTDIAETTGQIILDRTLIMNPAGDNFQYTTYNNSESIFGVGDCYKIIIDSFCDGGGRLTSEHFKIVSNDCNLKLLEWTNKINAFGFEYKNSGLTHRLRIGAKLRKPSYTGDKDIFIDNQG